MGLLCRFHHKSRDLPDSSGVNFLLYDYKWKHFVTNVRANYSMEIIFFNAGTYFPSFPKSPMSSNPHQQSRFARSNGALG